MDRLHRIEAAIAAFEMELEILRDIRRDVESALMIKQFHDSVVKAIDGQYENEHAKELDLQEFELKEAKKALDDLFERLGLE